MTLMDTQTEKYLTLDEIAKLLRYNKRTLYRWIKAGKLNATKIGAGWRVKESDLSNITEVTE